MISCHFIAARQFLICSEMKLLKVSVKFPKLLSRSPLEKFPFYMLIETSGSNHAHDEEKLNNFLQKAMETNIVLDGVSTNEPSKIRNIWSMREKIPDSLIKVDGYCFKYDISLPLTHFYEIVPATKEKVGDLASNVCGYGHIGKSPRHGKSRLIHFFYSPGDSNIHLNITCNKFTKEIYDALHPFIYEYTSKMNGSISAEHGIGFHKTKYLKYSKTPEAIAFMKRIKELMDPNGILNPYKVLPL